MEQEMTELNRTTLAGVLAAVSIDLDNILDHPDTIEHPTRQLKRMEMVLERDLKKVRVMTGLIDGTISLADINAGVLLRPGRSSPYVTRKGPTKDEHGLARL